jgi:hypothetical protein
VTHAGHGFGRSSTKKSTADRHCRFQSYRYNLRRMGKELTETTTELVRCKAWAALIKRISANDNARQALIGWVTVNKKIGKGTGKNAALLQREANRLMEKARPAVPVWIMPFARLTESFDPVRDHFDVLIIDEASQEDVVGIAPFFMADKVIVVGDNEQVTPDDVGGEQQPIQDLISQCLEIYLVQCCSISNLRL